LGIAIAISIALSFLLSFPYDIIAIVGVFLGINYFIRQPQMRKMSLSAWSLFGGSSNVGQKTINYYCMACGTKSITKTDALIAVPNGRKLGSKVQCSFWAMQERSN
jgi:hypothetical protein